LVVDTTTGRVDQDQVVERQAKVAVLEQLAKEIMAGVDQTAELQQAAEAEAVLELLELERQVLVDAQAVVDVMAAVLVLVALDYKTFSVQDQIFFTLEAAEAEAVTYLEMVANLLVEMVAGEIQARAQALLTVVKT